MLIFHIASDADWRTAQGSRTYEISTVGRSLQQEGFIHASRDSQAAAVLAKYYGRVAGPLTLLTIDTDLLTSPWRLDDVAGAVESFPHIYGPLNAGAVIAATALGKNAAGQWTLPTLPASI